MNSPQISVIMPVYNARRFLAEAVQSILNQTLGDFEFLIIDDGSTDGSRAILERFAARDSRICLISRENRGIVATLNEMIGRSQGEFLARMDADDIALPDRFALQVAYLRDHPEIVVLGGGHYNIDEGGRVIGEGGFVRDDEKIQEMLLEGANPINHPTAMMRRKEVLAVGGYRPEMEWAEDPDLWLRLGERGCLANLDTYVLKYRIHDKSMTLLRLQMHRDRFRAACDEAFDRRGLERRPFTVHFSRPPDWEVKFDSAIGYGWLGFNRGDRRMVLRYAIKAIRIMPLRRKGWILLYCGALKLMRRPGAEPTKASIGPFKIEESVHK